MAVQKDGGLIDIRSSHSVDETVEKLKGILQAKGISLFALVDHSGEAEKAGMKMRPAKLLPNISVIEALAKTAAK